MGAGDAEGSRRLKGTGREDADWPKNWKICNVFICRLPSLVLSISTHKKLPFDAPNFRFSGHSHVADSLILLLQVRPSYGVHCPQVSC